MLGGLEKALLALLLVVLMVGMGATLSPDAFRQVARRPRGVILGLASQFGWMPLIAYGLARTLRLPPELAIGLVLVGCTPGGTTSNLFTYYARADLALSIAMTVASTLAAVVVMPLLLWVYATPFSDANLSIPYGNIVTTLVLVLVPVALGMGIRARKPRLARTVERLGSGAGVGVLLVLIGSGLMRNGDAMFQMPPAAVVCAISLGVLGMGLGYLAARTARLATPSARAVALETGIQNSPLAFGIILVSFPAAQQQALLQLPLAYALFVLVSATLVTLAFRFVQAPAGTPLAAEE